MLHRLFPKQFDNTYRGSIAAIVILAPLLLMKLVIGFNIAGFNPWVSNRHILMSVDGIPLDTFSSAAASEIVFSSAAWGLGLVILGLLGVLALVRYRSMIPLMFVFLAIEQIGRKAIAIINAPPAAPEGGALAMGALINWAFLAAILLGLALSLGVTRSNRAG